MTSDSPSFDSSVAGEVVDLPIPEVAPMRRQIVKIYRSLVTLDFFESLDKRWYEDRSLDFSVAGMQVTCPLLNEDLEYFFRKRANELKRPRFVTSVARQVEGHGIFGADLDEWETLRKLSAPAFSLASLKGYGESVSRHTSSLIQELSQPDHQTSDIDLRPFAMRWSSRINNSLVFSDDFEDQVDHVGALAAAGRRNQSQDAASLFRLPDWIRTKSRRRMAAIREQFLARVEPVIQRRFASPSSQTDVLDRIIKANQTGSDQEKQLNLSDLTISFLMAGTSPTAESLALCLFVASRAPNHVQQMLSEIQQHAENGRVSEGELSKLEFTRAFVAECLRYYPPVGLLFREVTEDMDSPIGPLQSGQLALFNIWSIHHHKSNWDSPNDFRVDRFLGDKTVPRFAYMPFFHGPFRCIGAIIGREILVMALAQILPQVRFSKAVDTEFRPVLRPSMTYRSGIPVRVGLGSSAGRGQLPADETPGA